MSQNLEARIHGHQPPLPLVEAMVEAAVEADGDGPPEPRTDAEWRLDEHTRMVGRMGIAAARARLRSSAMQHTGPGRGTDRREPGRAA